MVIRMPHTAYIMGSTFGRTALVVLIMIAATLVPAGLGAGPAAAASGLNATTTSDDALDAPNFDDADNWNYSFKAYYKCVNLKNASAPLRYGDFSPVAAGGDYSVLNSGKVDGCLRGQVRLDAHEILHTSQGRLYFHKGGNGYTDLRTPYGHLWIGDIASGTAPQPLVTDHSPDYGAPSYNTTTNSWDWTRRNGRTCTTTGTVYTMHITRQGTPEEIPASWQYKPNESSSRYNKYADAGAEQSSGAGHYAYLVWSWMTRGDGVTKNDGGGLVRSLIKEGQPFYRCAVSSIDSVAYAPGTADVVGSVRVVYGKTRASEGGPWIYGWAIHSHRAICNGIWQPWINHFTTGQGSDSITAPAGQCPTHRAVVLRPDSGSGNISGYTLDSFGNIHAFGGAPTVAIGANWAMDHARDIVLRPDDPSGTTGYVLDSNGGIHPFGGAPAVTGGPYWHWDIARDIVLRPDGQSGYVLDGWGGLSPFGGAPAVVGAYWPFQDIARDIVLRPDDPSGTSGYVLDANGGIHPFGGAPAVTGGPYWHWDIARNIVLRPDGQSGYVLDGWGGLSPFGGAPAAVGAYWPHRDIARGIALRSDGTGGIVLDADGNIHPFRLNPASTPVPTATATHTPVPTETATNTSIPTGTATSTPVPPRSTSTATNTAVPTATATSTPESTRTSTNTPAPTGTATNTRVPTTTATSTSMSTGTATSTSVPIAPASSTATTVPTTSPGCLFSDVCPGDYWLEPVRELVSRGAVSGYSNNTFRPFNNTTRGQLAKIIVLAESLPQSNPGTATFVDVPIGSTFFTFVETAVARGLISGYDLGEGRREFRPESNVTRGQLAKIIVNAKGWRLTNPPTATFMDVAVGSPFFGFVETAVAHGVINGYDVVGGKEFRPGSNATRGQIAKVVYQAITQ